MVTSPAVVISVGVYTKLNREGVLTLTNDPRPRLRWITLPDLATAAAAAGLPTVMNPTDVVNV